MPMVNDLRMKSANMPLTHGFGCRLQVRDHQRPHARIWRASSCQAGPARPHAAPERQRDRKCHSRASRPHLQSDRHGRQPRPQSEGSVGAVASGRGTRRRHRRDELARRLGAWFDTPKSRASPASASLSNTKESPARQFGRIPPPAVWDYTQFANGVAAPKPDETFTLTFRDNGALNGSQFDTWTINNKAWPDVDPILVQQGKRYRMIFQNGSGDQHPMHLHAHTFEVTKIGKKPMSGLKKDVVNVMPLDTVEVDFVADNPRRHAGALPSATAHGLWLHDHDQVRRLSECGNWSSIKQDGSEHLKILRSISIFGAVAAAAIVIPARRTPIYAADATAASGPRQPGLSAEMRCLPRRDNARYSALLPLAGRRRPPDEFAAGRRPRSPWRGRMPAFSATQLSNTELASLLHYLATDHAFTTLPAGATAGGISTAARPSIAAARSTSRTAPSATAATPPAANPVQT